MLNYRQITWPMGKVVGGSSACNAMYLVRPSSIEVDVWHDLIKDLDGHDAWTSDSFFAAMRKVRPFLKSLFGVLSACCPFSLRRSLSLATTSAISATSSTMKPVMEPAVHFTLRTQPICLRYTALG